MQTRVVHCENPYDVYIGRPSPWGNPWSHLQTKLAPYKVKTVEEAVSNYRNWLTGKDHQDILQQEREYILSHLEELRGKTLGCFCRVQKLCHGGVLIGLLKEKEEKIVVKSRNLF